VLSAIDLNDEASAVTREIDNVPTESYLPSEMCTRDREAMAQMPPKLSLSVGG